MASDIEWTDETWNPVVGCRRVSPGCEHCYAERVAHRGMAQQHKGLTVVGKQGIRWTGEARFVPEALAKPLHWRKPRRVFVNSMSDLFHEDVTMEQIAAVFGIMDVTPHLTYQVLTKRPERMLEFFRWVAEEARGTVAQDVICGATTDILPDADEPKWCAALERVSALPWPLPNVWIGVSVEDQRRADERIPLLLQAPAALRFLSVEPLLERVSLLRWTCDEHGRQHIGAPSGIGWVIVGGESGPGARRFDVAWARSIIAQCKAAGVPVFVKQLGAFVIDERRSGWPSGTKFGARRVFLNDRKGGDMSEWPEDLRVRQMPEVRRGK